MKNASINIINGVYNCFVYNLSPYGYEHLNYTCNMKT